jgi:hypothetical protein
MGIYNKCHPLFVRISFAKSIVLKSEMIPKIYLENSGEFSQKVFNIGEIKNTLKIAPRNKGKRTPNAFFGFLKKSETLAIIRS